MAWLAIHSVMLDVSIVVIVVSHVEDCTKIKQHKSCNENRLSRHPN